MDRLVDDDDEALRPPKRNPFPLEINTEATSNVENDDMFQAYGLFKWER